MSKILKNTSTRFTAYFILPVLLTFSASARANQEFTVLIYNVENLMDIDDKNDYDDYKPATANPHPYSPRKLRTKLKNIAFIFKQLNNGKGPDIALLNEIETDKTPEPTTTNYNELLKKYSNTNYTKMLDADKTSEISEDIRNLPATFWLLKALADEGMTGYSVTYPARIREDNEIGNVQNITLSKFPIIQRRSLPAPRARDILEVHHNINGHTLITFNNHWKSGAGSYPEELDRIGAAELLRHRVLEILFDDPHADIILGGDFNANYNQTVYLNDSRTRDRRENKNLLTPRSSINDILKAQGFEKLTATTGKPELYNLWAELPLEQRGSDEFNGVWGTLMQMMITRGLYDFHGIQYIDNSFNVLILPENSDRAGRPRAWTFYGPTGGGFSDHLPICARFRAVADNNKDKTLDLVAVRPSNEDLSQSPLRRVNFPNVDFRSVSLASTLVGAEPQKIIDSMSEVFRIKGRVAYKNPTLIDINGELFSVFSPSQKITAWINALPIKSEVEFIAELTEHQGNLQFLIFSERGIVSPPLLETTQ
jgi:hypothetical protein